MGQVVGDLTWIDKVVPSILQTRCDVETLSPKVTENSISELLINEEEEKEENEEKESKGACWKYGRWRRRRRRRRRRRSRRRRRYMINTLPT